MNKKLIIFLVFLLLFLVGCSPIPLKLKRTSEAAIKLLNSELSNVNEFSQINEPTIVDMLQISETDWCLVHQITNDVYFASRWQKEESDWVQVEIRPYVDDCNWAR
jgi:predicted component of type VI protein secretion system